MTNFKRPVTDEELKIYNTIEEYMNKISDDEFSEALEKIADYVWEWKSTERKKFYNRLRGLAKKIGVKVSDLETWYCID